MKRPTVHLGINVELELFNEFKRCFPAHGHLSILLRQMIISLINAYDKEKTINIQGTADKTISSARNRGLL